MVAHKNKLDAEFRRRCQAKCNAAKPERQQCEAIDSSYRQRRRKRKLLPFRMTRQNDASP